MKIQQIDLLVTNYEETVRFYQHTLDFPLLSRDTSEVVFQIGNSVLKLIKDVEARNYYYHFAFTIHSNMFSQAKSWLQERVTLSTENGEDEVEFVGKYNAKSCYFGDPAGNIVEYIAREAIAPTSDAAYFSPLNVVEISEIGLTTNKINYFAEKIMELGIPSQDGKIVDEQKPQRTNPATENQANPLGRLPIRGRRTLRRS